MNEEDIYDFNNRESYEENDDWFECSCGWAGTNPMIIEEYGMVFYVCLNCGVEVY